MDLKTLFYTIFKSLNPYNYKELVSKKFSYSFKYFLFVVLLSISIMVVLFIPLIYSINGVIDNKIGHFDSFNVSSDFKLKESFAVLGDPLITFDSKDKNISDELLVFRENSYSYKRFILFGAQKDVSLVKNVDLVSSGRARNYIGLFFFFSIPSLIFWGFVLAILYFVLLIIITLMIMFMISRVIRTTINFSNLVKICIYASTIMILLQLLLMPFFRILALPIALYWVLVLIILLLWKEDSRDDSRNDSDSKSWNKNSKSNSIFGSSKHSDSGSKNSIPARDSYDVDEHGNMKGTSKRHRTVDEENNGYVELK